MLCLFDCGCCLVDALKEITSMMGVKDWRFDANSCQIIGVTPEPPENAESSINCDCHFENNNTVCNVVKMYSSLILLLITYTAILLSYASFYVSTQWIQV